MKRSFLLILALAVISVASGVLLSRSSWISKMGMTFFYKEYNFTKVWWEGALAVFMLLMLLFLFHSLLQKLPVVTAKIFHFLLLLAAAALLYYSYYDFHTNLSHRMLHHWFHYGIYLVWIGWLLVAAYFLFHTNKHKTSGEDIDRQMQMQEDDLTFELPAKGQGRKEKEGQ